MERRGLNEQVFGILVHEAENPCIGSGALFLGFRHGPEPGGIHVAVANEPDKRCGASVLFGQLFLQQRGSGGKSAPERRKAAAVRIITENKVGMVQGIFHLRTPEIRFRKRGAEGEKGAQIKQEIRKLLIPDHDRGIPGFPGIVRQPFLAEGMIAGNIMPGIALQHEIIAVAFCSLCRKAVAPVVSVRGFHKLGGIIGVNVSVDPERCLIVAHLRHQVETLSIQFIRYGVGEMKPAVNALTAPAAAGGGKECLIRRGMERGPGFIQAQYTGGAHRMEHPFIEDIAESFEFSDGLIHARIRLHGIPRFLSVHSAIIQENLPVCGEK